MGAPFNDYSLDDIYPTNAFLKISWTSEDSHCLCLITSHHRIHIHMDFFLRCWVLPEFKETNPALEEENPCLGYPGFPLTVAKVSP